MTVMKYIPVALPSPPWTKTFHNGLTPSIEQLVIDPVIAAQVLYNLIDNAAQGGLTPCIFYKKASTGSLLAGVTMIGSFRWRKTSPGVDTSGRMIMGVGDQHVEWQTLTTTSSRLADGAGGFVDFNNPGAPFDMWVDYMRVRLTMKTVGGVLQRKIYLNDTYMQALNGATAAIDSYLYFALCEGAGYLAEMFSQYVAFDDGGAYTPAEKSDIDILSQNDYEVGEAVGKLFVDKRTFPQPGNVFHTHIGRAEAN